MLLDDSHNYNLKSYQEQKLFHIGVKVDVQHP